MSSSVMSGRPNRSNFGVSGAGGGELDVSSSTIDGLLFCFAFFGLALLTPKPPAKQLVVEVKPEVGWFVARRVRKQRKAADAMAWSVVV